jgi:hypothetical protein
MNKSITTLSISSKEYKASGNWEGVVSNQLGASEYVILVYG